MKYTKQILSGIEIFFLNTSLRIKLKLNFTCLFLQIVLLQKNITKNCMLLLKLRNKTF